MASVTWPPLLAAAPSKRSRKVARARAGTAAAMRNHADQDGRDGGMGPRLNLLAGRDVQPQRDTAGRFVMAADPAILKRIRGCPFARGGRVLVRFRANGYSLFARPSGEPPARLRVTGGGGRGGVLSPSH